MLLIHSYFFFGSENYVSMAITPDMVRNWLVQMTLHNNSRAFREFFDYFYRDAFRLAFFYIQDKETAEELTSDVFLKLWERRESLGTVLHPRSYLLTSVKNHCLNHLRKQQPTYMGDLSLLDEEYSLANPTDGPEQELVWDEMQQALNRAIASLPPRCGLIFDMVRHQQLSYREVAEALGISPKTVEIQMGIALKRLGQLTTTLGESNPTILLAFLFSHFF